jgi:hypothetical protein
MTVRNWIPRPGLIASAFTLLLAFAPALSVAQQSPQPASEEQGQPHWVDGFGEQMSKLLESDDRWNEENAMRLILRYEQQPELSINAQPAVPALLKIYESDAEEGHRLLALSALIEVLGGEETLRDLMERTRDRRITTDRAQPASSSKETGRPPRG